MHAYDFSIVPGPHPNDIVDAGGEGVLTYSGNARQSDAYLADCQRAGLHTVSIWEVNTDSMFGSYDYAVQQCKQHESRVAPGTLTYVACDTRSPGDVTTFLRGWSDTTREEEFGIYGPDFAIRQAQSVATKCKKYWGVVNWIAGGYSDNDPRNIAYWKQAGAHLIQLIGSPIPDTDQNLIVQDDWWSIGGATPTPQAQGEDDNMMYGTEAAKEKDGEAKYFKFYGDKMVEIPAVQVLLDHQSGVPFRGDCHPLEIVAMAQRVAKA